MTPSADAASDVRPACTVFLHVVVSQAMTPGVPFRKYAFDTQLFTAVRFTRLCWILWDPAIVVISFLPLSGHLMQPRRYYTFVEVFLAALGFSTFTRLRAFHSVIAV